MCRFRDAFVAPQRYPVVPGGHVHDLPVNKHGGRAATADLMADQSPHADGFAHAGHGAHVQDGAAGPAVFAECVVHHAAGDHQLPGEDAGRLFSQLLAVHFADPGVEVGIDAMPAHDDVRHLVPEGKAAPPETVPGVVGHDGWGAGVGGIFVSLDQADAEGLGEFARAGWVVVSRLKLSGEIQ